MSQRQLAGSEDLRLSNRLDLIRDEWELLLTNSDADPLFNSPGWIDTWWQQYGHVVGAEPEMFEVRHNRSLVGIGCLGHRRVIHRFGIEANRLELLGTARGVPKVGFSERTEFVVDRREREFAKSAIVRDLLIADWDELLVSHTPENSDTHQIFQHLAEACGGYLRVCDSMEAWETALSGGFDDFVADLGAGTRQRIIGSRRRLEKAGDLRERLLGPGEIDKGMAVFSKLHTARWNRPLSEHWQRFYGAIALNQTSRGIPVMSLLEFNGTPISCLINFRAFQREYSIASAFVPLQMKRVSPGWLHLGLAIERAFDDGVEAFDFLGGGGKNEQYKSAFRGTSQRLLCLQLLRSARLKVIYKAWDGLRTLRQRAGIGSR